MQRDRLTPIAIGTIQVTLLIFRERAPVQWHPVHDQGSQMLHIAYPHHPRYTNSVSPGVTSVERHVPGALLF
jgi:hypothetical protein